MAYRETSIEGRLIAGEDEAISTVSRWISRILASLQFWSLRSEWLDLHQEVMVRVVQSLRQGRFDDKQELRVYVQAVARYTALEALNLRRSSGRVVAIQDTVPDDRVDAESTVVARQLARLVMDSASDECRRLIRTYFFEQRGYAEIAALTGVPIGTVKSRLARCLRRLQEAILPGRGPRSPQGKPEGDIPPDGS